MAKILGKDQSTYLKERDAFLRDLQHFHEIRGTPFKRPPTLGGKEVDLYLLYNLVTSQGGWLRVNNKNSWSEILPSLNLPTSCVNGSVGLKQTYLRYLDRWEKVHFLHEEADRGSDDDEESRHKRWSAKALHSVPYTYNYSQHNILDSNREYHHLSTNLYKSSDYDRLALSLISPLPNEQDFAINVCTLLSNDGKHTLKLDKHPRLINFLLGHAGIFSHSSLRKIFTHYYRDIRKRPMHSFWKDIIESKEFVDLTDEEKFGPKAEEPCKPLLIGDDIEPAILALQMPMEVDENRNSRIEIDNSDCEVDEENCDSFKLKLKDDDGELFCLRRGLGTQDYIGQRVLQIATILRNLSFIEENVTVLVKNVAFMRFLLLCSCSRWNVLRNLGMDMLSNMSADFIVKELQSDILTSNLLSIVTRGLDSEDRACCLSSLEVLNKLSQNEQNEDIMLRSLQFRVYRSVCSFLTIHDVMLLIYTLECLYSLSSLGERSCNFIVNNHGVIDTLVSLVTVEGKSYGPKACIGMKLVETLPSSSSSQAQPPQQATNGVLTSSGSGSAASSPPLAVTTTTTAAAATTTPIVSSSSSSRVVVAPSTPARPVSIAPQRLIPVTPTSNASPPPTVLTVQPASVVATTTTAQSNVVMTPQQLIQQQHAHQQAIHENEQFALAWLRATYEPCADGKVDHQELYKHYMSSCAKIGRRGVISPLHFPRCVRSIFGGTVGPNPMKPANPSDPQFYDGIKVRDHPLTINLPASCTTASPSPLLPKSNAPPAAKGQQARRKSVQPVLRQPLAVQADPEAGTPPAYPSPSSPILKAQLSAPPKPRDAAVTSPPDGAGNGEPRSKASAHPHLSQALLACNPPPVSISGGSSAGICKDNSGQTSSTSLIKSLLATKVNDCMSPVSMRTASDCQSVAQVAARQQRLLAQQTAASSDPQPKKDTPKVSRINGVRQLFADNDVGDPSVSSTTQFTSLTKGKKEPPQPPPPPLAPLSQNAKGGKTQRLDNEDSDSLGNNSLASSSGLGTIGIGGVSSTEDGDNSLTSFEGLLNGIPNIENPLNEDSNSKDFVKIVSNDMSMGKPLRLADLLEQKFEKSPPMLNGSLGKELRLGDKPVDLVENHIEKALNREQPASHAEEVIEIKEEAIEVKEEIIEIKEETEPEKPSLKRPATDEITDVEAKKPLLSVNGSSAMADSSSSNSEEGPSTVSTAAAKLFADIAADILEDEDEEQLLQEAQAAQAQMPAAAQAVQQIIVDHNQQMLLGQQRQIIVSQPQMQAGNQVVITAGTPMKTQMGQTVIVQNSSAGQRPVMLQQSNAGQFLLSQGLPGQVQLVAGSQPGQYVLQTGGGTSTSAYMVAQPQTAVVHGQQQTVLVAQTHQQQGAPAKTIIILQQQQQQQQPTQQQAVTQHQKVVVTPQGQQMVVTQVPRPIMHTTSISNNVAPTGKVIKTMANSNSGMTQINTNGMAETKQEEPAKIKIVRDLTTPYVCEWGDCVGEKKFRSANEVFMHACAAHCPSGSEEITCQWNRCDNMKRKRFSLMTHLQDKHCTTEAMKLSLARRKKAALGAKVETTASSASSSHPGYAPDAALHAIKRHALEFVNPKELQDDNEGPVTKSIRLTASLILRNLVIYSSHCKRYLKSYESHLANVALSNVESSRTIAQVLYDMNDGSTHR